jgi:hypothetical protein
MIIKTKRTVVLRKYIMSILDPPQKNPDVPINPPKPKSSVARWIRIILNLILVIGFLLLPGRVIPPVQGGLRSASSSLQVLSITFTRISTTLSATKIALESTGAALELASSSIEKSSDVIDSASGIVGDIGKGLIVSSQGALDQVETAAGGIDQTLNLLNNLGLLGQGRVSSQSTLSGSIRELNQVLDSWPGEFEALSGSLDQISMDIEDVTASLDEIQRDVDGILSEITALIKDLDDLSQDFDDTARELLVWEGRIPVLIWLFFGLLVVALLVNIWIQITQLLE